MKNPLNLITAILREYTGTQLSVLFNNKYLNTPNRQLLLITNASLSLAKNYLKLPAYLKIQKTPKTPNRLHLKWLGNGVPSRQFLKFSFITLLHPSLKDTTYMKLFYMFIRNFGFSFWRLVKHSRKGARSLVGFLTNKPTKALYLNSIWKFRTFKRRNPFKSRRRGRRRKPVILGWKKKNLVRLSSLKAKSLKHKALYHSKFSIQTTDEGKLFWRLRRNRVSGFNQTIRVDSLNSHTSKFVSDLLLEFRLKTSRFLNYDLNQTIIRYNVRSYYKPSRFTKLRWGLLDKPRLISNRTGLFNYLNKANQRGTIFLKKIKTLKNAKSPRRVPMFWVSKITQKTLTPIRREFDILNRKKLRYQYRLTVYILKYYRFKVLEVINKLEFNLTQILLRSKLLSNQKLAEFAIRKGLVFVNNLQIRTLKFSLQGGDVIQLALELKVLIFFKWNSLTNRANVRRFFFYLRKWRTRSFRPFPKTSSRRIPCWIRKRLLYKETVPAFIEVDFTIMSAIILFDWTSDFKQYHFMSINQNTPATVRPLNWKSLT